MAPPLVLANEPSVPKVSGSFSAGVVEEDGVSNYTIRYTYPERVIVGTNLTVTATLEVNALTGLKAYIRHYRFDVFAFVSGTLVSRATSASDAFATPLYAGAHWGPQRLLMPINSTNAGVRPDETVQANVTLSFLADVYHDFPISSFSSEAGRSTIGTVILTSPSGQTALANEEAALVVAVSTAVVILVLVKRTLTKRSGVHAPRDG
jgi:hypothetical protein